MRIPRRNGPIPKITLNARHVTETVNQFGTPTTTNVAFTCELCTVQPFVGDDLVIAQDGFSTKDVYTLFTATPVTSGDEDSDVKADEVEYKGKWYKVYKVQDWDVGIIPHFCATLVLKDGGLV